MSKGLTEIPQAAFGNCNKLKGDLVIPDGVRSIAMHAFVSDGFDGTLTLPEGLTYIGIYSLSCPGFKGGLVIPDSVELIDNSAFSGCEGFTSLKLPAGMKYICHNAFMNCKGMTGELVLPPSLVVIGNNAFSGTSFTGELVLPDTLESIGSGSFGGCTGITSIRSFPDSLKHIRHWAFGSCSSLKGELIFPDKMTFIGESAFRDCPLLTKVTFGKDMCSIGEGAFAECNSLTSAKFTGNIPDYYGAEEKYPSFPEGCSVDTPPSALKLRDSWEEKAAASSQAGNSGEDGMLRDEPYYWTMSLTGEEFNGAGYLSDVMLYFDESTFKVNINGREMLTVPYTADKYASADEDQIVSTDGFFCRGGKITSLKFRNGFNADLQLYADMIKEDGTSEEVVFHTGSEEELYLTEP